MALLCQLAGVIIGGVVTLLLWIETRIMDRESP